jgi:2-oxoglutarate ferredoxin oxidoreductase subunit alpha
MVFLSQLGSDFGIVVEQAEDEISAINMALGASYAGARAMVTTSGGGFALMTEGVSLAGMIETPIVIHLAQRPGPATGLPTRTEQGDLELVLYAGHGEFPRIIFAPGSLEEAFSLTQQAFNLADKYQVPVFVLTDQYTMDTFYNVPSFNLSELGVEKHVVKTSKDYRRFALTENGISPRGIPGFGKGLVGVDSDEHDEDAHITEDMEMRTKMVDKRLRKLDLLGKDVIPPEFFGPDDYNTLIIGWGSTLLPIKEALSVLAKEDLAFLHFKQVYPIHPDTVRFLEHAKQTIVIENNATSQFGKLIQLMTGFSAKDRILKYDGLAFTVEELVSRIAETIA